MLQVKLLENVYGIKNWKPIDAKPFNSINLIYAPNGTGKTSFSDGIAAIAAGDDPKGSFPNDSNPNWVLELNGNIISPASRRPFEVVDFHGGYQYPLSQDICESYLLTPKQKRKVDSYREAIRTSLDSLISLSKVYFPKAKGNKVSPLLSAVYDENGLDPIVNFFRYADLSLPPFPFSIDSSMIGDICNSNLHKVAKSIDPALLEKYRKAVNKLTRDAFLDTSFGVEDLESFISTASKLDYFSAKRLLKLGRNCVDKNGAVKLVAQKKTRVFSNPKVKALSDEILTIFSNKESRSIKKILLAHPELIYELRDSKKLMVRALVTFFNNDLNDLKIIQTEIRTSINNLSYRLKSTAFDLRQAQEVWDKFKNMFNARSYEVVLDKKMDKMTGFDIPLIKKVYPGTQTEISPEENRLSDGEKKTFFLINLILQIEMRLKENPSLIVFLDDAVDSFDYRNKYAFLEYISRLAPRIAKSGQLFLLSHNFDFYKGVFNCLRSIPKEAHFSPETNVSTFFLKNSNGCISVFDGRPVMDLLNLGSMGRWKHSLNLNEFVTYITIERTFLETRGKSQKALVPYLHYLSDQTTFAGINRAFKINNNPSFFNGDYYLPMLVNASDNLCSASPFETALADKICLAVAIRILRERFIILSIQKHSLKEETSFIRMQAVAKMEKRLQAALSDSEKMNLLFAKIVSNPNVHANGFSFEPIVDIGFDELIRSYQEMRAMNSAWPIGAEKANVALPS